jgi:hypothetical protein
MWQLGKLTAEGVQYGLALHRERQAKKEYFTI